MIKSLLKAIDILELFTREKPILSLSEISEALEMHKSTAHNILATLVYRGLLEKKEDSRFNSLMNKIFEKEPELKPKNWDK